MPIDADRRPIVWAFSTSRLRHVFESVAPLLADVAEVRVFDQGFEDALQAVARARRGRRGRWTPSSLPARTARTCATTPTSPWSW